MERKVLVTGGAGFIGSNIASYFLEKSYKVTLVDGLNKNTGANVVKELYEMEGMQGMWIATFADPDGNYFQLMTPWEEDNK